MGGLGCGDLSLPSVASSTAPTCESRVELSSLAHLGLASKKTVEKLDRCRRSLEKLSPLTSPSPAPGSPLTKAWADLTSTLTLSGKSLQSSLMSRLKQFSLGSFSSELAKAFTGQQAFRKKAAHFSSLRVW